MGKTEQSIARQAYINRQPLPDRIENAPKLLPGLEIFLIAVLDLDSERLEGQIPWSSVAMYADYFQFDEQQAEDLFYFVRSLDHVILERRAKKREADAKKNRTRTY